MTAQPETRHAPIALWRIAQAFLNVLHNLFGAPSDIARAPIMARAAYKQLASQGSEAITDRNEVVTAQNAAIEKQNAQLKQLTTERDEAITQLNARTREFNELVEKYNKLAKDR